MSLASDADMPTRIAYARRKYGADDVDNNDIDASGVAPLHDEDTSTSAVEEDIVMDTSLNDKE